LKISEEKIGLPKGIRNNEISVTDTIDIRNQKIVDKIQEFANITGNFPRFSGDKEHVVPRFCRWLLEEIQSMENVE